jgi:4a-hydroxytetrahydrobiopterin dehydratase
VSCSDTPAVPEEQLPQYLAALPAWQLSDDHRSISRQFVAKNFVAAVDFFNAVKEVAEAEGHHPDLHLTNYREVQVRGPAGLLYTTQQVPGCNSLLSWPMSGADSNSSVRICRRRWQGRQLGPVEDSIC